MEVAMMNWAAVGVGAVGAFALGMLWFSPVMFGKSWAAGSHDLQPPAAPPMLAMFLTFLGLALLAFVVGMTETNEAIGVALAAIVSAAVLVAGMDLFSQKTGRAALIDAGYILACGAIMILAQGLL